MVRKTTGTDSAKDKGEADGATSAAELLADDRDSQGNEVDVDPGAVENAPDPAQDGPEVPLQPVTATDPDEPREGYDGPVSAAYGAPSEAGLTNEQITARRTADKNPDDPEDNWPLDGRYRRVFGIAVPRVSTGEVPELDWDDDQHEAMHNANKVATLQEALNKGLHPRGDATFDGQEGDTDERSGIASLVYSVEVVPASIENAEEAALAYTPSAAIVDQGGSTLPEADTFGDHRE